MKENKLKSKAAQEPEAAAAPADSPPKRTHREAQLDYWREVKSGKRVRNEKPRPLTKDPGRNSLLDLPDGLRSKLYVLIRDCPVLETVNELLARHKLEAINEDQLTEFLNEEHLHHWELRAVRARNEADTVVRTLEKSVPAFSAGMVAALGQEAFRQVVSDSADPGVMSRIVTLFIKARGHLRTDEMHELKREKLLGELDDRIAQALQNLAEHVKDHPAAQEAFEALQREMAETAEREA